MNENVIKTISSEMNRYLNNYQMSKLNEVLYKRLQTNEEEISNKEYLNKFINSRRTVLFKIVELVDMTGVARV